MDDHSDRVRLLRRQRQLLLFVLNEPVRRLLRSLGAPAHNVDDVSRRVFQKLQAHRLHPAPRSLAAGQKSKAQDLLAKDRLLREELGLGDPTESPAAKAVATIAAPTDATRSPGNPTDEDGNGFLANAPIIVAAAALILILIYKYLL